LDGLEAEHLGPDAPKGDQAVLVVPCDDQQPGGVDEATQLGDQLEHLDVPADHDGQNGGALDDVPERVAVVGGLDLAGYPHVAAERAHADAVGVERQQLALRARHVGGRHGRAHDRAGVRRGRRRRRGAERYGHDQRGGQTGQREDRADVAFDGGHVVETPVSG
jgi:hypothetical protein